MKNDPDWKQSDILAYLFVKIIKFDNNLKKKNKKNKKVSS